MSLTILNACILDMEHSGEYLKDIRVENGCIDEIAPFGQLSGEQTGRVIRAEGMYLFPGLIDFHTHLFQHGSAFGLDADRLPESGVVCAVDMGSAGWANYPAFHCCDIIGRKLPIKSYLNLSPIGQPGRGIREPLEEAVIHVARMRELMEEYPGEICGVKVRISRDTVVAGALLHDIGKLTEFVCRDGKAVHGDTFELMRHPLSGAILASQAGVPTTLVHLIATHSFEGDKFFQTPEPTFVRTIDMFTFTCSVQGLEKSNPASSALHEIKTHPPKIKQKEKVL